MTRLDSSTRRKRALALRRQGLSYAAISRELGGIAKSTLSYYFNGDKDSSVLAKRLSAEARLANAKHLSRFNTERWKRHRQMRGERIRVAATEIKSITQNERKILFLGLFWGEGNRTSKNSISISNTDPVLLRACVDFLHLDCGVSIARFLPQIQIHEPELAAPAARYWSKEIGIPADQFRISIIASRPSGLEPRRKLLFGTCNLRVHDTVLRDQIQGWLHGLKCRVINTPIAAELNINP